MMSPKQYYDQCIAAHEFEADAQQAAVVDVLETIYQQVRSGFSKQRFIKKLFKTKQAPIKGLYLWGSVGVGKTWLMDIFYKCLPVQGKMRMHFHQFMQHIHKQLKQLQDERDPLKII